MGKIKPGHLLEAGLWLALVALLYFKSFEFDRQIEIYKFGATGWPRAILLLIVIAVIGQLLFHWKRGEGDTASMMNAASDDGAEEAAHEAHHSHPAWYFWTFGLLAIPFVYMLVPDWIAAAAGLEGSGLHVVKLATAALAIVVFLFAARGNHVGAMLSLPILFAAMLQDLGFYALAPFFILAVMFFMGERRLKPMMLIMILIFGLLLFLFVNLLYVGLPTGNIHPFYDFGTWVVTLLQ